MRAYGSWLQEQVKAWHAEAAEWDDEESSERSNYYAALCEELYEEHWREVKGPRADRHGTDQADDGGSASEGKTKKRRGKRMTKTQKAATQMVNAFFD